MIILGTHISWNHCQNFMPLYGYHEQTAYRYASTYRPFYCTDYPPGYLLHSMRHRAEWSIMERTSYQNLKCPLHQKQGITYIAICWEIAIYVLKFYVLILHMYFNLHDFLVILYINWLLYNVSYTTVLRLSRKMIFHCFKIITNTMTLMDYPLFQG